MNKVLALVANNEYIKHSYPVFRSALDKGKWDGDLVLIIPPDDTADAHEYENTYEINKKNEKNYLDDLQDIGVKIFNTPRLGGNPQAHFYKIFLFDRYFEEYDWIFYCDCDVLFLDKIKLNLSKRDKQILYANEDGLDFVGQFTGISENNRAFDWHIPKLNDEQKTRIDELSKIGSNKKAFQTCFLLFNSYFIKENKFQELQDSFNIDHLYYNLFDTIWYDQGLFNIVFKDSWAEIGDEYVNKNPVLDDTQYNFPLLNKGYKDTNDYDGKQALHFFRCFNPWMENNLRWNPIWKDYMKLSNSNSLLSAEQNRISKHFKNVDKITILNLGVHDGKLYDPFYHLTKSHDVSGVVVDGQLNYLIKSKKILGEKFIYENCLVTTKDKEGKDSELYILEDDFPEWVAASATTQKKHLIRIVKDHLIKSVTLETKSIETILKENNLNQIDAVNIDLEGLDFEIVMDTDFNKFNVKMIVVEVSNMNDDENNQLNNHLKNQGYHFNGYWDPGTKIFVFDE